MLVAGCGTSDSDPAGLDLAADESATIIVVGCDRSIGEVVLDVCSNGLGGTIARYES